LTANDFNDLGYIGGIRPNLGYDDQIMNSEIDEDNKAGSYRMFLIRDGWLGIAPCRVETNDVLCFSVSLEGLCFILRRFVNSFGGPSWTFVGQAIPFPGLRSHIYETNSKSSCTRHLSLSVIIADYFKFVYNYFGRYTTSK